MRKFRRTRAWFAWPLIALMTALAMPSGFARAALVTTDQVVERAGLQAERKRIAAFLMREDVRARFAELGLDPAEAAARVDGLTDAEVSRLAGRIDEMPAGQGVASAVIGALVLILIVFMVTDLLGYTDIFPFIKSQKNKSPQGNSL